MKDPEKYSLELGPIRPPNEGSAGSLLIRVTRNCPWNRCAFCPFYRDKKFSIRDVSEVESDINTVKIVRDMLVNGGDTDKINYQTLYMVRNWYRSGGRTAFLQDSNSLMVPTDRLVEIVRYVVDCFSSLERITSYARADTIVRKDIQELKSIKDAGLTRLHVGLESGDDEVLELMNKGVTPEQHVEAGRKAKEAGFELSEYVIPGLGGKERWKEHAVNTAKVLNRIDPDYIRMRPLTVHPITELHKLRINGEFVMTSPHQRLKEIGMMVDGLEVSSVLCFDHFLNGWRNMDGTLLFDTSFNGYELPGEKERVLRLVEEGLEVPETLHFDPRSSTLTSL